MIAWVVLAYHSSEPARVLPRGFYCQEEAEAYGAEIGQHCAAALQTVWNLAGVGLDWTVRWSNFEPSDDRRPTPQMPMAPGRLGAAASKNLSQTSSPRNRIDHERHREQNIATTVRDMYAAAIIEVRK